MKRIVYRGFLSAGCDRLALSLSRNGLRVLTYHGICEDELAREDWLPESFVTRSAFEQQLLYLRRRTTVLPLREAVVRLRNNDLPPRSVALTFDDGYANNLKLALPLLQKYECPATIFVATRYVESGELFPFDRLRLIRSIARGLATTHSSPRHELPDYRTGPMDEFLRRLDRLWGEIEPLISATQWRTLRPITTAGLSRMRSSLLDFGAHTHSHCILRNESPSRRAAEITTSLRLLRDWGKAAGLFAYPNGSLGDFDEQDKRVLRSEGVEAAFSMLPGRNHHGCDYLELKRYPVGLHHEMSAFAAEVTGLRTMLRDFASRFVKPNAALLPGASSGAQSEGFSALPGSPRS
jgi:hypothetical protein